MLVDVFRRYTIVGCIVVLLAYKLFSLRFVLLLCLIFLVVVFYIEYKIRQTRERRRLLLLGLSCRPNAQHEISKTARLPTIATRDLSRLNSNTIEHYDDQTHVRRRTEATNYFSSNHEEDNKSIERIQNSSAHNKLLTRLRHPSLDFHKAGLLRNRNLEENADVQESSNLDNTAHNLQKHQRLLQSAQSHSCVNRLSRLERPPERHILSSVRRYPTHHPQYLFLGSYPTVHFNKPETPILNRAGGAGYSPVTVKIAPIEELQSNERWSFIYSPPSSPSKTSPDPCDAKTVVAALRESRKRSRNVKQDLSEENGAKRRRRDTTSSSSSTIPSKFASSAGGRVSTSPSLLFPESEGIFSPGSDLAKRPATPLELSLSFSTKRHKNNAIFSSYSSSLRKSPLNQTEENPCPGTKRKAETNQSPSTPVGKASKLKSSLSSYVSPQSENQHDSERNRDDKKDTSAAAAADEEMPYQPLQKSPPQSVTSAKSPIVKEGSTNKRAFSLYASLGNSSKKDYSLPNHLATIEEFKQDKKLEEGRLKYLLGGVMDDINDDSLKTWESQSSNPTHEVDKPILPEITIPPLAPILPSCITSTQKPPSTDGNFSAPIILPSLASSSLLATTTQPPTTSFPNLESNPSLSADNPVVTTSSTMPPPPSYSLAIASLVSESPDVQVSIPKDTFTSSVGDASRFFGVSAPSSGPTLSIPNIAPTLTSITPSSNFSFTGANPFVPVTTSEAVSAVNSVPVSSRFPTSSSSPSQTFSKLSSVSITEPTFSYTTPISSVVSKPTGSMNGFQISASTASTPVVIPFTFGTSNPVSSGVGFFSANNSDPKKELSAFAPSTAAESRFESPSISITPIAPLQNTMVDDGMSRPTFPSVGQNMFGFPNVSSNQTAPTTTTLFGTAQQQISATSTASSPFGSVMPTQFGTLSANSNVLGSSFKPSALPSFGTLATTVASSNQNLTAPSFFASPPVSQNPIGFGNLAKPAAPSQPSNIFGGGITTLASSTPQISLPVTVTTSSIFATTTQPHFGTISTVKPTFASSTPNIFGGFGNSSASTPTFGATATQAPASNIFGQSQPMFSAVPNMEFGSSSFRPNTSLGNSLSTNTSSPFQLSNPVSSQATPVFNSGSTSAPNFNFNFGSTAAKPGGFNFSSLSQSNENPSVSGGFQPGQPFVFTAGAGANFGAPLNNAASTPANQLFSVGSSAREKRTAASRRKGRFK